MNCILRRALCLGGFSGLGGLVLLALPPLPAVAQTPRVARVGWLGWAGDTAPDAQLPLAALRAGLADLGWREGHNLKLELQRGEREQAPALAAELVRLGVDVIVAQGVMVFQVRTTSASTPGAKPGDLPIEQPTRFHLTLNLRAARELRLALPASLRSRADEVVG